MRIERLLVVLLILAATVLSGCSKDIPGIKKLGDDTVAALKDKNLDAYIDLCVTIKEKRYLIAASDLTLTEKKSQAALIGTGSDDLYKTRDIRMSNFNDISSSNNWDNVIVDKVVLGKLINEHGIIYYRDIVVKFKQNIMPDLEIGRIVKVRDAWKIMDDQALSFKSMI